MQKPVPPADDCAREIMGKMSVDEKKINCRRCSHYFITYDPRFPYGCRVMGFKSRDIPSTVVYRDSGAACRLYSPKARKGKPSGGREGEG